MAIRTLSAGLAGLLLLATSAARSGDFDLTLRASAGYSDNVNLTDSSETSSSIYAPGLDINYREVTRHVDATVRGSIDYLTYTAEELDDQLAGNFYADVAYGIVPESLVWNFDEAYGQGSIDYFQPLSPGNTQGINYFSTGPELTVRLSDRNFMTANAQYANSWYEDSNTDSNQYGGGVSLGRTLSQATNVQLAAQYTKIDYIDRGGGPDSDIWQYYLAYAAQGARSELEFDVGYRSLDSGGKTHGGPLIRLSFSRQLSAYSTVFLLGGDEYSDSGNQLNADLSVPGDPGGTDGYADGRVFVDIYGGGGVTFDRMRTRFGVTVIYHDQDYVEDSTNDVRRWNVDGHVERDLSREWAAGLQFWYYDEEYPNLDYSDSEFNYGLYARWQFARTVGLTAEWDRSQTSATSSPDATENQYWLRLNWHAIHRPGRAASAPLIQEPAAATPPGL